MRGWMRVELLGGTVVHCHSLSGFIPIDEEGMPNWALYLISARDVGRGLQ
jgi:hypothetical protein